MVPGCLGKSNAGRCLLWQMLADAGRCLAYACRQMLALADACFVDGIGGGGGVLLQGPATLAGAGGVSLQT